MDPSTTPPTLEAVIAEARRQPDALDSAFDVPVLLVVTEDESYEGATAVTAPGARRPGSTPSARAPSTFVVALRSRNPKAKTSRLSFGRAPICDVVLPFSPVSKHHGYFDQVAGGWVAIDVGSTNGTVVDGKVASEADPAPMNDGATLQLGKLSARFLSGPAFVKVLRQRLGQS